MARDFKPKGEKDREDLFAAMPPWEAKRLMFRMAARSMAQDRDRHVLIFVDVKKAHLNGRLGEDEWAFVKLPKEAGGKVVRLRRWLHGMRPAAGAWERDYREHMEKVGFARGRVAPTVFYNMDWDARCVVHGDDFTFLAPEKCRDRIVDMMRERYEIKLRGVMGSGDGEDKKISILNRELRWDGKKLVVEADPEHAQKIVEAMGLQSGSKGLESPAGKEVVGQDLDEPLHGREATAFRAIAARANYLSIDRADIRFATKEACRDMAQPTRGSWMKLKKIARYLVQYPRAEWAYGCGGLEGDVMEAHVYCDSDWAGCRRTRRSTSGGVATVDGGVVKTWSSTQATIATSSGEAEYYALAKAAAEGLGIQSLARDLGWDLKLILHIDSSAAKSVASRTGLGKLRHLEVRYLWIQEALKSKRFKIRKIPGAMNPSDALTKPMSAAEMQAKLNLVGGSLLSRISTAMGNLA